jgi:hypothetical protein
MQNADAESGVGMAMREGPFVGDFGGVHMNVDMLFAIVFVLVRVQFVFESFLQSPKANPEQHHPDEPFAPGRKQIDRHQIPQPQGQQTDDCNSGGMPESPANARHPRPLSLADGQRRDGSQMIWSQPDMSHSRNQTCYGGDHFSCGPSSESALMLVQQNLTENVGVTTLGLAKSDRFLSASGADYRIECGLKEKPESGL